MKRQLCFWFVLFLLVASVTMHNSLEIRAKETHLAAVQAETKAEQDRLRVLTAEWASLSAPERIEELAAKYLEMKSLESTDMLVVAELPDPLPVLMDSEEAVMLASSGLPQPKAKPLREKPIVLAEAEEITPVKVAAPKPAPRDDMISELIVRDTKPGVLWASYKGNE
jgi:cell division protein FtsL